MINFTEEQKAYLEKKLKPIDLQRIYSIDKPIDTTDSLKAQLNLNTKQFSYFITRMMRKGRFFRLTAECKYYMISFSFM